MIEIILIFFQIFFIGCLINLSIPKIKINSTFTTSLTESLILKSIIFINILLVFSLLNISLNYLIISLIVFSLIHILKEKEKNKINFNLKNLLIFIYIFIISIALTYDLQLGWDAKFFWFLKTINFYQDNSLLNLEKLPATDYPHLGAYIWSFFWRFPFDSYEYLGRIFYVFLYILSIFYFCEIFKSNETYKLILSSLIILTTFDIELFNGNQEIVVFSLMLVAAKLSYELVTRKIKSPTNHLIFLLLSFNAALWVKNEGLFLLGFILLIILFFGNLNLKQKKFILLGSILLITARFVIFYFLNTELESFQFEKTFSYSFFENLLLNLKTISFYSIVYSLSLPLILLSLLTLLLNIYLFKIDKIQLFIIFYLILNVLFIFAAFIFTMEDVEWQVKVGLKRVMFESSGFYLLTIVYLFNKIKR
tara:strand:- start:51 stop:1316 length:1266 start_codon:yes stop_codon:yes gene_type:complete